MKLISALAGIIGIVILTMTVLILCWELVLWQWTLTDADYRIIIIGLVTAIIGVPFYREFNN